jgi:hypothetical protein
LSIVADDETLEELVTRRIREQISEEPAPAAPGVRRTEQLENGCWTADAHSLFGLLGGVVAGYGSKDYPKPSLVPAVGHG